jgi:vacuolar iron transporter family protein
LASLDPELQRRRVERLSSVREFVFGVQDGILTTAGIICSLSGAVSNRYHIVMSALAATAAGSLSMGAGAYLGSKSENEVLAAELARAHERAAVEPYVIQESLLEELSHEGLSREASYRVVKLLSSAPRALTSAIEEKVFRVSRRSSENPFADGVTMGMAFLAGSFVPLLPYVFLPAGTAGALAAAGITAIALFAIGYFAGRLAERPPIISGARFLSVAAGAAVAGYVIGLGISKIAGLAIVPTA